MNYLSVENLTKSYGAKLLFNNISFGVNRGQRTGLIARNGAGKSTLFKILKGLYIPDEGKVVFRNNITVGFLEQEPPFDEEASIADNIFSSTVESLAVIKAYEEALELFERDMSEEHMNLLQKATEKVDDMGVWNVETRIKQILSTFKIHDLDRKVKTLSGGQRKRVALAKLLIEDAEFLILDEPTNHLDVEMIEWLEHYLVRQSKTLLLVTHDRYFLDNVCDDIIEIDDQTLYHYEGDYEYFLEKKADREANKASEIDKARNTMRKELEWIRRMPKARGTKSKSRIDAFYQLKEKAAGKKAVEDISLDVRMSRLGGKIIELKKVYKSFGELPILKGFDYTFKTGERIGVVGPNGVGKSTFLNIIQGIEQADSGKVNMGDTVVFGYYSQGGLQIKEDKRVIEVVKDIAEVIELSDRSKITAQQMLNLFQFSYDMQFSYVSKLSGGERRRLHLLTVLMKNPNFLILDEPTNDLDLITLGVLEDFLMNYKGCLLIVSHDRYFMDKLIEHMFVFEGNGVVSDFWGNYTEYRAMKQSKDENSDEPTMAPVVAEKKKVEEPVVAKRKLSFKEKFELENIESEIAKLEEEKEKLNNEMNSGISDHEKLNELSARFMKLGEEIDAKTLRWIELGELAEN